MTNKNMTTNFKPFLLKPAAKDYLWGGTRLNDEFAKGIDLDPLAETWECSIHPDGPSVVASGEFEGQTLTQVLGYKFRFTFFRFIMAASTRKILIFRAINRRMSFIF